MSAAVSGSHDNQVTTIDKRANQRFLSVALSAPETKLLIPNSAHAQSTAAHKRVTELGLTGAGDLPVNEVRQNSGNATYSKEC